MEASDPCRRCAAAQIAEKPLFSKCSTVPWTSRAVGALNSVDSISEAVNVCVADAVTKSFQFSDMKPLHI